MPPKIWLKIGLSIKKVSRSVKRSKKVSKIKRSNLNFILGRLKSDKGSSFLENAPIVLLNFKIRWELLNLSPNLILGV